MKETGKIFSFTFVQHVKQKGYRNATVIIALLCLLLPAVIMPAIEYFDEDETYESKLNKIYVVDKEYMADGEADFEILNGVDPERFTDVAYETAESVEEAAKKAEEDAYAALLVVDRQEGDYKLNVLLPKETKLEEKDADAYGAFLSEYFRYILIQELNLESTQVAELTMPIKTEVRDSGIPAGESDEYASMKGVLGRLLPYLNIMILYFMILAYGQGTWRRRRSLWICSWFQ